MKKHRVVMYYECPECGTASTPRQWDEATMEHLECKDEDEIEGIAAPDRNGCIYYCPACGESVTGALIQATPAKAE